jgi:hypothetical protein
MFSNKQMKQFKEKQWDTYRDLEKVFKSEYCQENGITYRNALVIDSDPRKVQMCLANSLTNLEYTKEDVLGMPRMHDGKKQVLDAAWHEQHLSRLADFVLKLLDDCDNVPDYLLEHPSEFRPPNLLTKSWR